MVRLPDDMDLADLPEPTPALVERYGNTEFEAGESAEWRGLFFSEDTIPMLDPTGLDAANEAWERRNSGLDDEAADDE